ncbi:hypothetical protein EN794_050500 [Mesorhizobium sp. M00.F.Ca.ET.151.01.1.1]|nr:hypothetical protein EN794_050500 [Mesorhizobium sp. M00.F.Ca.ET.151.01.1.1]
MTARKRQSLRHMTPDEKAEYVRERERQKKARQRDRQKAEGKKMRAESPQAKSNWPRVTLTPELEEFIDELVKLDLAPAARALAMWERENRQRLRLDDPTAPQFTIPSTYAEWEAHKATWEERNVEWKAYEAKKKRAQRFALIGIFAVDALDRDAARERNNRYREKEATEANALGISIEEYQRRKRAKRAPKRREEQFVIAKGLLEKRVEDATAAALRENAIF